MSKHETHKVKLHQWLDGVLQVIENYFENIDDAAFFINATPHHNAKIHNKDGEVIFNSNSSTADPSIAGTYA